MNRELMKKVRDAIADAARPEAKPQIGFNMNYVWAEKEDGEDYEDYTGHNCDTVCCIAGWTNFLTGGGPSVSMSKAGYDLDLHPHESQNLFMAEGSTIVLEEIKPLHAVRCLDYMLEGKEAFEAWSLATRE